jgi:hypothetical protein
MPESRNSPEIKQSNTTITWQHNAELKLLAATETHNTNSMMYVIKFICTSAKLKFAYGSETLAL